MYCLGLGVFARDKDANLARIEFYIVIGQASRHLDRNMSTIGRVIYGTSVQTLNRANMNNTSGVIQDLHKRGKILWAKLAKNVSPQNQLNIQIQAQNSEQVKQCLNSAKKLDNSFFILKAMAI